MAQYDLLIIGAGPGGYVSAIRAAQLKMKVAVVECSKVGGTCLNRGCVPTKALIHSSELYAKALSAEKAGVTAGSISYDMDRIFARKTEISETLTSGIRKLLKANKIDFIEGFAQITKAAGGGASAEVTVCSKDESGEVECCTLTTDKIIIATGMVPFVPSIPGSDLPGVVTSTDILEGPVFDPKSIVIVGGSVIGIEFATFYEQLGIKVTVIEGLDRLLSIFDKEFGMGLKQMFKKRGIDVCLSSSVTRIEKTEEGLVTYFNNKKNEEESVTADAVLMAVGRRPKMDGLLGEGIELEMNGRHIKVDENFETSVPGIYAIGDIIGGIQLAHVSSAEGKSCVEKMAGLTSETDLSVIPSCVYSEPEIASVGLTADEAVAKGIEVKTGKFVMGGNARSIIEFQDRGFIKVVVDAKDDKVIGAQLMCQRASDIVGEFATAIVNRLTYHDLERVVRGHPTFYEGVTEAIEAVEKRSIHSAPVDI